MFLQDPTIKGFDISEKKQNIADTKISPIAIPSALKSSKPKESSNLLPILIIAGVGLFLMKS